MSPGKIRTAVSDIVAIEHTVLPPRDSHKHMIRHTDRGAVSVATKIRKGWICHYLFSMDMTIINPHHLRLSQ